MGHVVVTPFRNEESCLPRSIEAMISQSILPSEWVLVDDFSTDGSKKIVEDAMSKFPWIKLVSFHANSPRSRGEKIARLFNYGVKSIDHDWEFCSKIDADMILPEGYFRQILEEFENEENLGIASGNCFIHRRGDKVIEKVEPSHTRGGLKTYRRECFESIGGVMEMDGWDGIDNAICLHQGWITKNVEGLLAEQTRDTGKKYGSLGESYKTGVKSHIMGYSWAYLVAKSIFQMPRKPRLIGSFLILMGFIASKITRVENMGDKAVMANLRKFQRKRLKEIIFREL